MTAELARRAAGEVSLALEERGLRDFDPYDALASPAVRALARTRLLRGGAIQALRRSPVNLRPLLGVPRLEHAKGLALLVSAYARLARLDGGARYGPVALALAERLARRARPAGAGVGFGYDFDVQTRWGYYRRGQPNAVVTAFAAHALLDAAALGAPHLRRPARAALAFAVSDLLVEDGGQRWFAYYPGSRTPIHNASLLLASLAPRLPESTAAEREAAAAAVAFSLRRQREDGSWPYGEEARLQWVDGFHTAYVLGALAGWHEATGDPAVAAALAGGASLYLERLLDSDGAPRASLASRYPVESHAAGSALRALALLRDRDARALPAAESVLRFTLASLRRRDGRFAYRRCRLHRNAIAYTRWSDGHVLLGLASYLLALEGLPDGR